MSQDRLERAIFVLDTLLTRDIAQDVRESITVILEEVLRMRKELSQKQGEIPLGDTMITITGTNTGPIYSAAEYTISLVNPDVGDNVVNILDQKGKTEDRGEVFEDRGPRTDTSVSITGVSAKGQA